MKAVIFDPEHTNQRPETGEINNPVLSQDNQILVNIKAAGINPIDIKILSAPERFPVQQPLIPGCDGAGIIEAVGKNVTHLKAGDEVYFSQPPFNGRQGTYAEYVLVDASLVASKPRNLTFEQAAAAPLVFITAAEALHERAHIQTAQNILIHAGAGGVGHAAIQLAKLAGANVCTTVSNKEKADFATSLGADSVIIYPQQNIKQHVMQWTNNQGVDIAFDTVGGQVLEGCFEYTKVYGDVVTLLQPDSNINWSEARKRNLRFSMELMLTPVMLELENDKNRQAKILNNCSHLFEQNRLSLPVIKTFAMEDVNQAHEYLQNTHPSGKVVLKIDPGQ